MAVLDVPANWVMENGGTGSQADAVIVGGTTALTTDDGLTSYAEGYINAATIGSGYFRFTFPPTVIPGTVTAVELAAVGQRTPGTMRTTTVRCGVGHRNDAGTLVNINLDGSDTNPTTPQFPMEPDWLEIVKPLTGAWANVIAGGTNSTGRLGDLSLEGCRLTYLALRVTYEPDAEPILRVHPRSDGRGLSSARRVWPPSKASQDNKWLPYGGGYR